MASSETRAIDLAPGEINIQEHGTGSGWYLIQLGRGRYTKRFNISAAEAVAIRDWLNEHLKL